MRKRKTVIIGAGHVGSHCAYSLAVSGAADEIILTDILEEKAKSQAADIADGLTVTAHRPSVRAGDYGDCADADIAVIAAGMPRKPGQTRLDTMADSIAIVRDIAPKLRSSGFDGILITITNPADIIADFMSKHSGLPENRVFSTGTGLDSARLRRILSEIYRVDRGDIRAFSMGEHGDSQVVAFSAVTFGGIPLSVFDKNPDRGGITARTRRCGTETVEGKGSTEFGIGTVLAAYVSAIYSDSRAVLPASAFLTGQYGVSGIYAGVPCVIGRNGIERVVELPLTEDELRGFHASAAVIRKHTGLAEEMP